ncbi:MAG: hypothetical protein LBH86_03210 [Oscillospiraceae bacterium]|jgi:outer membrane protein TolC|nr:hypothetical protein [Oscillospiraceae bacterium]
MKRRRLFGVLVISVALSGLLLSSAQSVYGNLEFVELVNRLKTPPSVLSLESQTAVFRAQQSELDIQRRELRRQLAVLDAQDRDIGAQEKLLPLQVQQESDLAEYQFQAEYYNICLLIENASLLEHQLALTDKQIEVEETKLSLDMTTQHAVDLLYASRETVSQSRAATLTQIDVETAALLLKIDISESYAPDFSIPEVVSARSTRSLADLQAHLVENNPSMRARESAVSNQLETRNALRSLLGTSNAYYSEAAAQYDLLAAQRDAYKSQLFTYASTVYNEYTQAEAHYRAAVANREVLLTRLDILDSMYAEGEISEMECLSGQYEARKGLLDVKAAIVTKANSLLALDLMATGLVLNVG